MAAVTSLSQRLGSCEATRKRCIGFLPRSRISICVPLDCEHPAGGGSISIGGVQADTNSDSRIVGQHCNGGQIRNGALGSIDPHNLGCLRRVGIHRYPNFRFLSVHIIAIYDLTESPEVML